MEVGAKENSVLEQEIFPEPAMGIAAGTLLQPWLILPLLLRPWLIGLLVLLGYGLVLLLVQLLLLGSPRALISLVAELATCKTYPSASHTLSPHYCNALC